VLFSLHGFFMLVVGYVVGCMVEGHRHQRKEKDDD